MLKVSDSSKIRKTVEILSNLPPNDKIIIFSHFVTMLHILESKLRSHGITSNVR